VLLFATATLLLLSTCGQVSKYYLGHPRLMGLVDAFYVDLEANVPAWFSSVLLGMAAALLTVIACIKLQQWAPYALHWGALAILFLALSADEIAGFHELPIDPMRRAFNTRGLLYYGWVVPGALFVLGVGAAMIGFLRHLPRDTRRRMMLAGCVYVGGALGVEMLSGAQADAAGEENFTYALIVTLEEALEMLGIVLFLYAIIDHIHQHLGGLQVVVGARRQRAAPAAAHDRGERQRKRLSTLPNQLSTR
jgi:hypothetical protein